MFRSKSIFWITFAAFCLSTGSCTEFYEKAGDDVKMNCDGADSSTDTEWRINNNLLLYVSKSGRQRKGVSDTSKRAQIEGKNLKVSSLKSTDSGEYTCKSSRHTLYVVSARASPSSLLYSGETKLSCNVAGDSELAFRWFAPAAKLYGEGNEVTVKNVTSEHNGVWTCQIQNKKAVNVKELKVNVDVVGPLISSEKMMVHEGDTAELPCILPALGGLPITGGSWTHTSRSGVRLPALMRTEGRVQWNKTNVNTHKVGFTDHNLKADFNVTLKKVSRSDDGVYVCRLVFEGGRSLNASLTLTVLKRDGSAPDQSPNGSSKVTKSMWHKRHWGVQLWIWSAALIAFIVLIVLVAVSLLIHRRNKRIKRKIRRLKSLQQPKHYCDCDRSQKQIRKSPGKKERPPPLPRHQYSSLNE